MKDSTQVALFFNEGTIYNPTKVANALKDKIENIGDPVLLPINLQAPKEANIPFIIFNQAVDIQVVANFNNIILTFRNSYLKDVEKISDEIFDIFKSEGIAFRRIGYVPSIFLEKNEIEKFKEECMTSEIFNSTVDFQFAWLKKLDFMDLKINCWKRVITDTSKFDNMLNIYDFNTDETVSINVNKEFINDFLNFCNEYIKNN